MVKLEYYARSSTFSTSGPSFPQQVPNFFSLVHPGVSQYVSLHQALYANAQEVLFHF